jgi:hypothetical protein
MSTEKHYSFKNKKDTFTPYPSFIPILIYYLNRYITFLQIHTSNKSITNATRQKYQPQR